MAYFRDRAVNLLNLHYWLHAIAATGGTAFFSIYLLKAGLSIPAVFVSIAAILLGRFIVRPLVVPLAVRWGLRATLIAGTLISASAFPFLAEVDGIGTALLCLIAVTALGDTIYWTTYHAYFASLGDDESRGRQVSLREAIATVLSIASPLATGWMLVTFGPRAAFGTIAAIEAAASLPVFWSPEVPVAPGVEGAFRAAWPGFLLFAADGWIGTGFLLAWQIALFVSLGQSFIAYGGALAIAAVAGALAGVTLGRHIDAGHGGRAVWYAFGTMGLIVILRAAAFSHPTAAVLANALGAVGSCLYVPTLMTAVYTMSKRSPCALRFHVVTEGGWDAGGASALLTAALLTWSGVPLPGSILLALAGIAAMVCLLRRYYTAGAEPHELIQI